MATTDTRSGFRLPWSSDRPHDELDATEAPDGAADDAAEPADDAQASAPEPWPDIDIEARPSFPTAAPRPHAEARTAMPAPAPVTGAPRKPTKLMVDLAAAIIATTEQARDQRLGQLETEAASAVELIRAQSVEGSAALRRRADDDVAAIKEWAKAEIARIREESESRIGDRKRTLEREIEGHAAAIEDRVSVVETTVGDYRARLNAYFERLAREEDPARLATMAEAMPEPPSLELLVELDDPEPDVAPEAAPEPEAPVAISEPEVPMATSEPEAPEADPVTAAAGPDPAWGATATPAPSPWGEAEASDPWTHAATGAEATPTDDPDGRVEGDEQVDRDAIMAALEADAEAVVAAEAAVQADDANAEADRDAQAALAARVDASDLETVSYAERLASLLPAGADTRPDGETGTTRVSVTGLVSVASIASFKRHLGRLPGVVAVAVASGPDGEFIFNVTHRPDTSLRDAIPTLPGFAARVTSSDDGVVSVTARDPETEA
jgi:hypothetical protein